MPTAQVPRPRPYHNYLTPLLHRQFLWALLLSYGPCHLVSLLLGFFGNSLSINLLYFRFRMRLTVDLAIWSFIPLPFTLVGLRTLLITACGILVFIIRIWGLQRESRVEWHWKSRTHFCSSRSNNHPLFVC
jgi:ABC-type sulfate transport system permease component